MYSNCFFSLSLICHSRDKLVGTQPSPGEFVLLPCDNLFLCKIRTLSHGVEEKRNPLCIFVEEYGDDDVV